MMFNIHICIPHKFLCATTVYSCSSTQKFFSSINKKCILQCVDKVDTVEFLIEHGSDTNMISEWKDIPIILAMEQGMP